MKFLNPKTQDHQDIIRQMLKNTLIRARKTKEEAELTAKKIDVKRIISNVFNAEEYNNASADEYINLIACHIETAIKEYNVQNQQEPIENLYELAQSEVTQSQYGIGLEKEFASEQHRKAQRERAAQDAREASEKQREANKHAQETARKTASEVVKRYAEKLDVKPENLKQRPFVANDSRTVVLALKQFSEGKMSDNDLKKILDSTPVSATHRLGKILGDDLVTQKNGSNQVTVNLEQLLNGKQPAPVPAPSSIPSPPSLPVPLKRRGDGSENNGHEMPVAAAGSVVNTGQRTLQPQMP